MTTGKLPIQILFFAVLYASTSLSVAKDLYVSTSGNDSTTYANNNINLPWKTLIHAIYNLKAGDTLHIRGGTYTPAHVLWTKNDYTSKTKGTSSEDMNAESGTESMPVVITGYQDEDVTINLVNTRRFIELDNKSYWTFRNLTLINTGAAFNLAEDLPANHNTFENLVIIAAIGGDNSGNIRLGGLAEYTTIRNCVLRGPGTGGSIHQNTTALFAKTVDHLIVANNELSNAPIGLYFKHANSQSGDIDIQIVYNYVHDTSRNVMQLNTNHAHIAHNVFGHNNAPLRINEANGRPGGDYNTFRNNTLLSKLDLSGDTQSGDAVPGAIRNKLYNNLLISGVVAHQYDSFPHNTISNHNLYPTNEAVRENRVSYTLSQWKSRSGQDANAVAGSPTFTGGSNPNTIAGHVLSPGSFGFQAGDDGKDMGADLSKVGSTVSAALLKSPPKPPVISGL